MLDAISKKTRVWGAAVLAVFYAFCLLTPAATFAFGNPEPHCFTESKHGLDSTHVHQDGVVHSHDSGASQPATDVPDGGDKAKAKCCGLFCVPALAASSSDALAPPSHPHAVFPSTGDSLVGGIPARLYRPPALAI